MAPKVEFDTDAKLIRPLDAPDGFGVVSLDWRVDIYSGGITDWAEDSADGRTRRGHTFPIIPVGGVITPAGQSPILYVLLDPWQIDADVTTHGPHELYLIGSAYTDSGAPVVIPQSGLNVEHERGVVTIETAAAADITTLAAELTLVRKLLANAQESDPVDSVSRILDDDDSTVLLVADLEGPDGEAYDGTKGIAKRGRYTAP